MLQTSVQQLPSCGLRTGDVIIISNGTVVNAHQGHRQPFSEEAGQYGPTT